MIVLQPNVAVDTSALERAITTVPDRLRAELRKSFVTLGATWHKRMGERQFTGFTSGAKKSPYADKLQWRSGDMLKRLLVRYPPATGNIDSLKMLLISYDPSSPIQELGGVVAARSKKAMTIPMDAALTGAGVTREGLRPVKRGDQWETKEGGHRTFIYRSEGGKAFIAMQRSKRARMQLLFQLVKRVVLPPGRLGFVRTWEQMAPEIQAEINRAASAALGGA